MPQIYSPASWKQSLKNLTGKTSEDNERYLSIIRFEDDIVLFAATQQMLEHVERESKNVGLNMNLNKGKIMSNDEKEKYQIGKHKARVR